MFTCADSRVYFKSLKSLSLNSIILGLHGGIENKGQFTDEHSNMASMNSTQYCSLATQCNMYTSVLCPSFTAQRSVSDT